ncbi:hypothetical protein RF11_01999 [Thelohanellus kitauei]|uniref:Uncharacterized protein n=1 Tax=Thelohanellus kitauei TaxID=669202 RepID=A0A0C2JFF8_THEKT|nr:hypothetical protein RF11_01999 [Thelohanellus kitauei]
MLHLLTYGIKCLSVFKWLDKGWYDTSATASKNIIVSYLARITNETWRKLKIKTKDFYYPAAPRLKNTPYSTNEPLINNSNTMEGSDYGLVIESCDYRGFRWTTALKEATLDDMMSFHPKNSSTVCFGLTQ